MWSEIEKFPVNLNKSKNDIIAYNDKDMTIQVLSMQYFQKVQYTRESAIENLFVN